MQLFISDPVMVEDGETAAMKRALVINFITNNRVELNFN